MDVVFDMDGVIVDTEHAVRQSYLEVGAVAPDDVLGCEGTDWFRTHLIEHGDDEAIGARYQLKQLAYRRRLGSDTCAPLLPPFATASWLYGAGHHTHLLTGAETPAAQVLYSRLEYWPFSSSRDGLRTPYKMSYIRGLSPRGVYVDDQDRFIDLPDGWRFVRYSGQSAEELHHEIIGE